MLMKWPMAYFCAFAYFLNEVNAKICEKTELVTTIVEETFRTPFIESYHGQCPYSCIKTRWATTVSRRSVPKTEWKTVKYCCTGYMEIVSDWTESEIVCVPVCAPCKHGYCKAPSECACNNGYIPDPTDAHNCLPSCVSGCEHGRCVYPETCLCDDGYKLVNTTCQPVCTSREPCQNGICVAPETCECLPGYRKSRENICEPYCSKTCDNGLCTESGTCLCNPGWQEGQNGRCEPICSKPCANGICVAPDTCVCKGAYAKAKSGICEPVCTPPCGNGTCIAPQTCSCFPGYHVGTDNIYSLFDSPHLTGCTPTCTRCRDVHCIAPEKCYSETLRTQRHSPDRLFDDYLDKYDDYYPGMYDDSYIDIIKSEKSKTTLPDDTITESIKHPFHKSTRPDVTDTDILEYSYGTSTADDVYTEAIKDSVDKITSTDDKLSDPMTEPMNNPVTESTISFGTNAVTGSMKNPNNGSTYSEDAQQQSMTWLQHHWVSIFIPVLVIVTAAAIMLLVWRWAPIIIFFRGRSYVVEGDPVDINASRPFEDIQISAINEKEKVAEK